MSITLCEPVDRSNIRLYTQRSENVTYVSIKDSLIWLAMKLGWAAALRRKMFSITEISVAVVSKPQNAAQSFTTKPPPITSLPRLTVPAYTWNDLMKLIHQIIISKSNLLQEESAGEKRAHLGQQLWFWDAQDLLG